MPRIKLLVGLGNPGEKYDHTRHNAGFWLLDEVCHSLGGNFKSETKFYSEIATVFSGPNKIFLLKPSTFMNRSGQAVSAFAKYYDISVDEMVVAHDELDLPVGVAKLKRGGGHAGHNGLRDIIKAMGSKEFLRLRIGIDRPSQSQAVVDYVLGRPGRDESVAIEQSMLDVMKVLDYLLEGDIDKAMLNLHSG